MRVIIKRGANIIPFEYILHQSDIPTGDENAKGNFYPVTVRSIHNSIRESVDTIGPNVQGCFAIKFVNPNNFEEELKNNKTQRKILLTIDDGFSSFYENAWPILKEKKIPFILFVSTREVGSFNYMTWEQIKEISKENFVEIAQILLVAGCCH